MQQRLQPYLAEAAAAGSQPTHLDDADERVGVPSD